MATKPVNPEIMLAEDMASFTHDPLGYAVYSSRGVKACWPTRKARATGSAT